MGGKLGLGAYDLDNHMLTHVTGEENCNADRVIECLEQILKKLYSFFLYLSYC